jgi:hypothetical protein
MHIGGGGGLRDERGGGEQQEGTTAQFGRGYGVGVVRQRSTPHEPQLEDGVEGFPGLYDGTARREGAGCSEVTRV